MNILLLILFLLLFLSSTLHGMHESTKKCHYSPIKIFSDNDEGPSCEDMINTCGPCIASGIIGKICCPDNELVPWILGTVTFCAATYLNNKRRETDAILKRKRD